MEPLLAETKLEGTNSDRLNRLCFKVEFLVEANMEAPVLSCLMEGLNMDFFWILDPLDPTTLVTCTFRGFLTELPNTICVATAGYLG